MAISVMCSNQVSLIEVPMLARLLFLQTYPCVSRDRQAYMFAYLSLSLEVALARVAF